MCQLCCHNVATSPHLKGLAVATSQDPLAILDTSPEHSGLTTTRCIARARPLVLSFPSTALLLVRYFRRDHSPFIPHLQHISHFRTMMSSSSSKLSTRTRTLARVSATRRTMRTRAVAADFTLPATGEKIKIGINVRFFLVCLVLLAFSPFEGFACLS